MSFWDDSNNLPPSITLMPDQSVQGTITMRVVLGQYGNRLKFTIDGVERWSSMSLWKQLAAARIEPGDLVRIARNQDTPAGMQSWTVERLQPAPRTTEVQVMKHTVSAPGPAW
jgi:hypothetical protein